MIPQFASAPSDLPGPRTFVVGDVHACGDELEALVGLIHLSANDRVIFVGDIVDRGPAVTRVFDLVRSVGGELVRGNHEDKLLRWRDYRAGLAGAREVNLAPHHKLTVEALRPEDWRMMAAAPLFLEIPEHRALVVHAGLRPGVAPAQQDPDDLCRLQGIGRTGRRRKWGTAESTFWASVCDYDGWVIYGHTHFREPVRCGNTLGIDTGCCFGGRLTALELPSGRLHQVRAARNYVSELYRAHYGEKARRIEREGA